MDEKDKILIATEDEYGCLVLLSEVETPLLNWSKSSDKYKIEFKGGYYNPGIFKWRQDVIENYKKCKYLVLVFDLDKQDVKKNLIPKSVLESSFKMELYKEMLSLDIITRKFDELYYGLTKDDMEPEEIMDNRKNDNINDKKTYINMTNPDGKDYMGKRVILLPIFFCFESLLLYSDKVIETFSKIDLYTYINDKRKLIDYSFSECLMAFRKIYRDNIKQKKNPQKHILEISIDAISNKFPDIEYSNDYNKEKFKKSEQLFRELNLRKPEFVKNEIVGSIIEKSNFNKQFSDFLQISSDTEFDDYMKKYCFHNYKNKLEKLIELYGHMLLWDPSKNTEYKKLDWYKDYLDYLKSICNDEDEFYTNKQSLDTLCLYYITYYQYNNQIIDSDSTYDKDVCIPKNYIDDCELFDTISEDTDDINNTDLNAAHF